MKLSDCPIGSFVTLALDSHGEICHFAQDHGEDVTVIVAYVLDQSERRTFVVFQGYACRNATQLRVGSNIVAHGCWVNSKFGIHRVVYDPTPDFYDFLLEEDLGTVQTGPISIGRIDLDILKAKRYVAP